MSLFSKIFGTYSEKQVKKLKEVGIVSRVGSNKSGSWKVDIKEDRQL